MQKIKIHLVLATVAISILALLVLATPVSAQSTPWQINGNNVYYTDGKVGIGTRAPTEELDIVGDIKVRGPLDQAGEGGSIHFTTFGRNNNGPKIKSSLVNADGVNSQADLILSSYYGGDMDEITLRNGNVGIGTTDPTEKFEVKKDGGVFAKFSNGNNRNLLISRVAGGSQSDPWEFSTGDRYAFLIDGNRLFEINDGNFTFRNELSRYIQLTYPTTRNGNWVFDTPDRYMFRTDGDAKLTISDSVCIGNC